MALESSLCVLGISRCFEDSLRIALQERDSGCDQCFLCTSVCDQCFLRGCVFSKQNVVQPQLAFVGSQLRVPIGISTSVSDQGFPKCLYSPNKTFPEFRKQFRWLSIHDIVWCDVSVGLHGALC